jgi:hypothetical protein
MAIKNTNNFQCKTFLNLPKIGIYGLKIHIPSGNTASKKLVFGNFRRLLTESFFSNGAVKKLQPLQKDLRSWNLGRRIGCRSRGAGFKSCLT